MKFRTLDGNWDWNFGTGLSSYASDSEAIAYDIKSKILSWYRDCFFAKSEGVDWKNILGSRSQKQNLDNIIRKIIVEEEGVIELGYFYSEIISRSYHCTARIKTIYNETIEVKI